MKHLFLVGGTMGIGKTTVCQELKKLLPNAVFLDGDWCWDADPFQVTDETKAMVQNNITYLLNSFLHCTAYENVIFCWVMHQQKIIDDLLADIDTAVCEVHAISLLCTPETLSERIGGDVSAGIRNPDVLARSLPRLPLYEALQTDKIYTDGMTPKEIAELFAEKYTK